MPNLITASVFVPIDIGKNVHWLAAYCGFELDPVIAPHKLRTHRSGFQQATRAVDNLLADAHYDRLVLGHEPTGIYHEAWARAFLERYAGAIASGRLDYQFVNPLAVKRQRSSVAGIRHRKTDRIDLLAIAYCLRDQIGQAATLPTGDELRFSLWVRTYRQTEQERRRLARNILRQIDRLWPGLLVNVKRFEEMHPDLESPVPLVRTKPLERKYVRALLQHCPNPHDFRAWDVDLIQAFFRCHVGRCGPGMAKKAKRIVQEAVLPPSDVADALAPHLQADFQRYVQLEQRLHTLDDQIEALVPMTPAAVLTTIPGVSATLAARYLGYLGDHQRFDDAAQIWAFAGFDPITDESGDYRRVGKISKKGHPGFRDTLFLIGLHMARQIPSLGRTKQKARQRGKNDVGATIHAASRANRICHRLLYDQRTYDPARLL